MEITINYLSNADFCRNYRSISAFFTRPLKPECRQIEDSCVVSPADGTVLYFGLASNAHIEQVKGVSYSLEAFLGDTAHTSRPGQPTCDENNNSNAMDMERSPSERAAVINNNSSNNIVDDAADNSDNINHRDYVEAIKRNRKSDDTSLYQCIVYLAPGDYHRFHSPTEWRPQVRRHFAGELLSVSPRIAQWLPGLFCLNERALYMGEWEHGFFSLTAVGKWI